ncbi:hypothetical protein LWI28_012179 [Acer negundo]|uniref:Uncharacterized protein n=1 Tax=Acer negundo TaxID=4023 RepID=A0AAD5NWK7_ACENE|nr:hypothetical protein LWI28_012179 [Acer negundo]
MVRKVGTSSSIGSSSSKYGSKELTSSRYSTGSSTMSAFGDEDVPKTSSPGFEQVRQDILGLAAGPGSGECWEGYNSEDFFRGKIDHSRFTINDVRENKINKAKLVKIATEFLIPKSVGIRIPREGEWMSNPEGTLMAFHPAFLEIRLIETAKDRMADKGKGSADKKKENKNEKEKEKKKKKKKKKKKVIPLGPSLLSEDEATEQMSLLKRARAEKSSVTVAFKDNSS